MRSRFWRHLLGLIVLAGGLVALPAFPARAAVPSGWALVTPADVPTTGSIAFQSNFTHRAVTAELNYGTSRTGMLRARGVAVGPWGKVQRHLSNGCRSSGSRART